MNDNNIRKMIQIKSTDTNEGRLGGLNDAVFQEFDALVAGIHGGNGRVKLHP